MRTHYGPKGKCFCGRKKGPKVATLEEFKALDDKTRCGNCRLKLGRQQSGLFSFGTQAKDNSRRTKQLAELERIARDGVSGPQTYH